MKYEWLDEYLMSKPAAEMTYKEEWQMERFKVCDKLFATKGGDKYGVPIINIRLEPARGALLRSQYKDIIPGYYANKTHWNSLYLDGNVPDEILKSMIDESYNIAFASLTKASQRDITE